MIDYSNIGLNLYLQPVNSPTITQTRVTGYGFDSIADRGVIINSLLQDNSVTNAKIVNLDADKINAGTVTVSLGIGGANVLIDGANNRIVINDGTNDRVLLGFQENGF